MGLAISQENFICINRQLAGVDANHYLWTPSMDYDLIGNEDSNKLCMFLHPGTDLMLTCANHWGSWFPTLGSQMLYHIEFGGYRSLLFSVLFFPIPANLSDYSYFITMLNKTR